MPFCLCHRFCERSQYLKKCRLSDVCTWDTTTAHQELTRLSPPASCAPETTYPNHNKNPDHHCSAVVQTESTLQHFVKRPRAEHTIMASSSFWFTGTLQHTPNSPLASKHTHHTLVTLLFHPPTNAQNMCRRSTLTCTTQPMQAEAMNDNYASTTAKRIKRAEVPLPSYTGLLVHYAKQQATHSQCFESAGARHYSNRTTLTCTTQPPMRARRPCRAPRSPARQP